MSPVNFSNVLQHLEVIERMHRSNVLTSKNAEDVKQKAGDPHMKQRFPFKFQVSSFKFTR
ncbi:MAG: hypothetical protein NTY53_09660 [Kiritimatiellaeota bacterium]|nr:hypothetical protein [Kiritimatiellota bacterium]